MWLATLTLFKRDTLVAFRHLSEVINPLMFFLIVISLFPMSMHPEKNILAQMGPGVIWVAALLASMLSLDGIFRSDFEDGTLEQIALTRWSLPILALMKVLVHWLISGLPMLLLSPMFGFMFNLNGEAITAMFLTLLLGTPILSLIGAIGAALTVSLRRGGVLLSLLVLPLYIPVLIFGAGSVADAALGLAIDGPLLFLGAILVLALTLAPLAIAGALRLSLE